MKTALCSIAIQGFALAMALVKSNESDKLQLSTVVTSL